EVAGRTLLESPLSSFGAGIETEGIFVPHPQTGWALPPSRQFRFAGQPVITNTLGLRGPEPVPDDSTRIVVVGDSTPFGHGVSGPDSFPSLLEKRLSETQPVQVQNAGVPGFTCPQSSLQLDRIATHFQPDILVLYQMNTDATRVESQDKVALIGLSPLLLETGLGRLSIAAAAAYRPQRPRERVSLSRYKKCLEEMLVQQANRQAQSLLVVPVSRFDFGKPAGFEHPGMGALADYRAAVRELAEKHHVPILDMPITVQRLKLSANEHLLDEVHPTKTGHTFIADAIADLLQNEI
ncbi:MAG: GDSL-type esterase/lipase family protein, partial [Myxococcota bacterium]|nr:GDSL-type esterase/lipase family protein [Myxococcota bacterium]